MLSRPLRSSPQRTQRVSSFALAERAARAKTSISEKSGKWFLPVEHSLDRQNNLTLRSLRALRETKFISFCFIWLRLCRAATTTSQRRKNYFGQTPVTLRILPSCSCGQHQRSTAKGAENFQSRPAGSRSAWEEPHKGQAHQTG
jgi:hypothetical protein